MRISLLLCVLASSLWAAPARLPLPEPTRSATVRPSTAATPPAVADTLPAQPAAVSFQLGITRLRTSGFAQLQGRRVGLLTHAAAVDERGVFSADNLLAGPGVQLTAIYSPEHGLDGLALADEKVGDTRYRGIPVFSIYGATRQPTPQMLQPIDVMVVDLQDVGVRSYTYISALKLTIKACFQQNIPVIVLDRPNPLGGQKVDGPILLPRFSSYVGMYQIPYVHGLTIGELAQVAQAELRPLSGSLTVIPMSGWQRRMLWSDLGLRWQPTSPAIPTLGAAFGYAFSGLGCQLGGFRHGYGTAYPFRFLSHPRISPAALQARLDRAKIPGFSFQVLTIPQGQRGAGQQGVYVRIDHWQTAAVTQLSLTLLQIAQELEGPAPFANASASAAELFNKHWGRAEPLHTLASSRPLNAWRLARHWQVQAIRWQAFSQQFWLYR